MCATATATDLTQNLGTKLWHAIITVVLIGLNGANETAPNGNAPAAAAASNNSAPNTSSGPTPTAPQTGPGAKP
jgi:hypothetical protein